MEILFPAAGHGPGVVVAHAWWGLNQTIRDYGAALVDQGFVVGLVDLFEGRVTDRSSRPNGSARPTGRCRQAHGWCGPSANWRHIAKSIEVVLAR